MSEPTPKDAPAEAAPQLDDVDVVQQNLRNTMFERASEAIYVAACGFGRVVDLEADQIPRLMTASAVRGVEMMLESYQRASTREREAGRVNYQADKARRELITNALLDVIGAFEEGLKEAHKLRLSLLPKEHRG